jgi:hypothetical protein
MNVGLKLKDKKSGRIGLLTNDNKPIIYTPYRCEEIILRFRRERGLEKDRVKIYNPNGNRKMG